MEEGGKLGGIKEIRKDSTNNREPQHPQGGLCMVLGGREGAMEQGWLSEHCRTGKHLLKSSTPKYQESLPLAPHISSHPEASGILPQPHGAPPFREIPHIDSIALKLNVPVKAI